MLWCCHHGRAIARVHPVHLMNVSTSTQAQAQAPLLTCQNRIEIKTKKNEKMIYAKRLSE